MSVVVWLVWRGLLEVWLTAVGVALAVHWALALTPVVVGVGVGDEQPFTARNARAVGAAIARSLRGHARRPSRRCRGPPAGRRCPLVRDASDRFCPRPFPMGRIPATQTCQMSVPSVPCEHAQGYHQQRYHQHWIARRTTARMSGAPLDANDWTRVRSAATGGAGGHPAWGCRAPERDSAWLQVRGRERT